LYLISAFVILQVTDKRVSRNHAIVEISDDGKLVITPVSFQTAVYSINAFIT